MSELFCAKTGVKMTHIPYRGTALAVADAVAGNVTMVFSDPVSALPHVNSGTLKALAVTSPERSPVFAQVPTMKESGYPEVEAVAWHGIFVPARTPQPIVDRLNAEIVKALEIAEIKDVLSKQAMQPVGDTPQQFAAFLKKDIATWKDVATLANVSVE
jgi:tripartite-type tricarboxylate transporter receptor subunit TctC